MISRERIKSLFTQLAAIDNPSRQERAMCEKLKELLNELGIPYEEDDAGQKIGGSCGNLHAYLEGEIDLPPILLSSHMDCVDPACGKKPVFHEDGTVTSDGTTVLGADDLSGLTAIFEALTVLKEEGIPHRPVELLFDVSEETYCTGIQQFDFSSLRSKEAYVLDLSGPVGSAASRAPAIVAFRAEFRGLTAHAGFAPEDGIHAIQAAARAVAHIPCGHVGELTVNVGKIQGGIATNIVPDLCTVWGEVRGFENEAVRKQLEEIRAAAEAAAASLGATVAFTTDPQCIAYRIEPDEPVCRRFLSACEKAGIKPILGDTHGCSDNNIYVEHGLRGLVIAGGMNQCHSTEEYTSLSQLEEASRLVLALITSEE